MHSYQCDIDSGWEVIWLHCGGELCDKYLKSCNLTIDNPIYNISNEHQITLLFNDFATGFGDNKLENPWIAIKFLHNLFLSLHYCISNSSHNKVKNLMEYITINTDSLDEIAANAGYSKCHFIRLFKQQTGKTPWAVILEKKVNLSKELLLGTTMSIKEISDYLGFEHQDYFAKLFKKHVHVTPKNFRKNLVL